MRKTIVYVDGFNLYYGLLKDSPYKWLDLAALFRRLLSQSSSRSTLIGPTTRRPGAEPKSDMFASSPSEKPSQEEWRTATTIPPRLETHRDARMQYEDSRRGTRMW